MPRKYQRKTETKYKVEDVKNAVEDVKNKKLTLSKASAIYSVPKSTLHDYIRKQGKETKCGKNAVFTNEQEKVLEEHIIKCGKHFGVITKDIVRKVAFKFADVNKLKHSFDQISQMAGKDWFYGFRKRHPNIDFNRTQSSANFVNEADIKTFFNNWEALLYIGANVLCKSVYNDDKARSDDVQKQFGLRPRRRRNAGTTRSDSESSSSETSSVLNNEITTTPRSSPTFTPDESVLRLHSQFAIEIEVDADVHQNQQQMQQQSQRNIQKTQARPYSNAERQKRYREKRKVDRMNACSTFSQSSDVQLEQEQPQHDVKINKRQPQSNAERQKKYRRLLREQQQQQQPHTSRIHKPLNVDQAEHKRHLNKQRQRRFRARQRFESPSTSSHHARAERYYYNPKRLTVLCERVLKKYKLLPAMPPIEPSDYFVVGGKPLRKRKEPMPEEPKDNNPKTNPDGSPMKKRGRPKSQKQVKKKADGRPRPKKHEMELFTFTPASENTDTDFEEESVIIKMEELDIPPDDDPFAEEKPEFLVDIKEEYTYNEDNEENNLIEAGPSVTETSILMPTLVPTLKPGQPSTSKGNTGAVPVISVILDDIQIFANSVAEQLRAMPVNRALLLQLDIQNMIDNEKQIMKHES